MLVYKVSNIVTDEVYIGSTTRTLSARKAEHLYKSKKKDIPFNFAIKTYGISNFVWEVLENGIKTKTELKTQEDFYISKFISEGKNLYNKIIEGHFEASSRSKLSVSHRYLRIGCKHKEETIAKMRLVKRTDEHKQAISKASKGRVLKRRRPFSGINVRTGELVGTWDNVLQCCRDLGISESAVRHCLSGKTPTPINYFFKEF